jgi:hypothetical protein
MQVQRYQGDSMPSILPFRQLRTQHPDLSAALDQDKSPISVVLLCVLVVCARGQDDCLFRATPGREARDQLLIERTGVLRVGRGGWGRWYQRTNSRCDLLDRGSGGWCDLVDHRLSGSLRRLERLRTTCRQQKDCRYEQEQSLHGISPKSLA